MGNRCHVFFVEWGWGEWKTEEKEKDRETITVSSVEKLERYSA